MITDNAGTDISLTNIPVTINETTKQIVCLVIKQDGNEVKIRLNDSGFGFTPLEFFNEFIDAVYKEDGEAFTTSYSISANHIEKDN